MISDLRGDSTHSDPRGHYNLAVSPPKAMVPAKYLQPEHQIVLFFWADGFRPLTRRVEAESAVLNVSLEDAAASEWRVPSCHNARKTRPVCGEGLSLSLPKSVGGDMRFTLPCGPTELGDSMPGYGDGDFPIASVAYKDGGKEYILSMRGGPLCCSGDPGAEYYGNSRFWSERSWAFYPRQEPYGGMDARGVSKDGTYWRKVNADWFEEAGYESASEAAAKYFDAILDTMCIEVKPASRLDPRH